MPRGGTRANPGARDRRLPERSIPVDLPGTVYFAGDSPQWGGGVAFYDHDDPGAGGRPRLPGDRRAVRRHRRAGDVPAAAGRRPARGAGALASRRRPPRGGARALRDPARGGSARRHAAADVHRRRTAWTTSSTPAPVSPTWRWSATVCVSPAAGAQEEISAYLSRRSSPLASVGDMESYAQGETSPALLEETIGAQLRAHGRDARRPRGARRGGHRPALDLLRAGRRRQRAGARADRRRHREGRPGRHLGAELRRVDDRAVRDREGRARSWSTSTRPTAPTSSPTR